MKNNLFKIMKDKKIQKIMGVSITSLLVVGAIGMNISASNQRGLPDTLNIARQGNFIGHIIDSSGVKKFQSYVKKTDTGVEAYCMEHEKPAPINLRYTRRGKSNDKGIKHILASNVNLGSDEDNYYVKQVALNYYLGQVDWIENSLSSGKKYRDEAIKLANEAKDVKNGKIESQYETSKKASVSISDSSFKLNGNYYETDWFNVKSTSNLLNYTVKLTGAPSNAQILNSSNKVVTTLSKSDKKFKIRFHKDDVNKSYPNMKVYLNGTFKDEEPYIYDPSDTTYQIIALLDDSKIKVNSPKVPMDLTAVGSIKVVKSGDNGYRLQGAKFELKKNGTVVATGTTDSNGELLFKNLEVGTYEVVETKAPVGFILNSTSKTVVVQSTIESQVNVENKIIKGKVSIEKSDSEISNLKLQGAKFEIYDNLGAVVDTLTTNSNGYAESKSLEYGNYTMKEISSPVGYNLDNSTVYNIKISQNGKVYNYNIENDVYKSSIEVIKVDADDNTMPVEGAGFDVIAENVPGIANGTVVEHITTDANGYAVTKSLRYGVYKIKETVTPEGYWQSDKDYFVDITENNKVYTRHITNNAIQSKIRVIKTDGVSKEIIEGVKFKIVNKKTGQDVVFKDNVDGNTVDKTVFVTDDTGEFVTPQPLRIGDYQLVEVETNEGYILANPIDFTISKDTPMEDIELVGTVTSLEVVNQRIKGDLNIVKIDEYTKEPLENVEFMIECIEGFNKGLVYRGITDFNGQLSIKDLEYGIYEITEIKTKEGYNLNSQHITIDIKENEKLVEVEFENKPIEGYIEINKVDSETNRKLAGTKFEIWSENRNLVETIVTDENGYAKSGKLPYGNYNVIEVESTEGYIKDEDRIYQVGVSEEGKVYTLDIENDRQKGELIFNKLDSISQAIVAGAVMELKGLDIINEDINMTFDSIEGGNNILLPIGRYEIKELEAPEYYILNENPIVFEIKAYETTEVDFENKPVEGYIEINKVDSETNRKLAGTKFEIWSKNRNLVETIVTDENGYAKSGKLPYGNYNVIEVESTEGYIKDEDRIYQVGVSEEGKVYTLDIENDRQKGELIFNKLDSISQAIVAGAVMELKGLDIINEDINMTFDSIEGGNNILLPIGRYEIKELEAPEYYILNENPVVFEINADKTTEIDFENKPVEGYIEVYKIDSETKRELEGTKFEIWSQTRVLMETIVTDENGYAISGKLPYGNYYVIESEATQGYLKGEDVVNKVSITEEEKVYTVNMENHRQKGSLVFTKTDFATGEVIEGATIEIKGLDEINKDINIVFISKKEGNEITLPVGKYEIKETIAPDGYILNEEVGTFEIKENGEIVKAEIKNKKVPVSKPLTGDNSLYFIVNTMLAIASITGIIVLNKRK